MKWRAVFPVRACILGFSLLSVACSQLPLRDSSPWQAPHWTQWTLSGRVAVWHGQDGWHAQLRWTQQADSYQLELSGPLGQGALRLQGDEQGVTLELANGQRDWAPSADQLLQRHTGWQLPIAGMRYWARGLAVPERPADWDYAPDGRPQRLRQDGWDIHYSQYRDYQALGCLPRRIDFSRGPLTARLIIDHWQPNGPSG